MPDEKKPKIVFAPSDKVDQYEAEVQSILAALGHPEALVTDWSRFSHFITTDTPAGDYFELDKAMGPLGLHGCVELSTSLWEAARLLRMKRQPQ